MDNPKSRETFYCRTLRKFRLLTTPTQHADQETIEIRPPSTTSHLLGTFIKIAEDTIAYPQRCSACLSPEIATTRRLNGARRQTTRSAQAAVFLFGLIGALFTRDENLVLKYKGQVPYCPECNRGYKNSTVLLMGAIVLLVFAWLVPGESILLLRFILSLLSLVGIIISISARWRSEAVHLKGFSPSALYLEFDNSKYERSFLEENAAMIVHHRLKEVTKIEYLACPKCHEANPANRLYCINCGQSLK